jgi:serine/threonine-protein kinase
MNLRDLFESAVALAPSARAAFLDAQCPDPAVRARIESLLRADASEHEPVSSAKLGHLAHAIGDASAPAPPPGSRIGPFEIVRVIGEGGSSTVFEAHRELEGARQGVALKLLRQNLLSPEARRRFGREQRALISLQHPNIARMIEAGLTPEGLAYIALELVDGLPITDFARVNALGARERLQMFATVCRAVDAAHRALIVHRDIKPSNVLVTADGEVKLLDFGIAKLLADETGPEATVLPAFTPAYAAPEQVDGGVITTATDVYSLGVVLRELLTGARSDDGDVRTPSNRGDAEPSAVHGPITLRRLRGDLDAVVTKATEADPERRYASAGAFAEDIERLLDDRPVHAQPQTRWYRTRKFVARHKGGVATTVAFLLAIFAALGIAVWQAGIARENARVARAHASRAEAVRQFMVGVFENASPDVSGGKPITAQELLAKGGQQVDAGLRGEPALEADVLTLLGQLNIEISDFDKARDLLARALQASTHSGVPTDVRVRALNGMAWIEVETGSYEAALGHAQQALALLNQEELPDAADIANAHQMITQALVGKGDRKDIEATLRANLARDEAALGRANGYVAEQWLQLGVALGEQGRYDDAEIGFRNAIEGFRLGFGENSNRVAHALNEYSNMLDDKGDLAGSEAALRRALAIREATVGANHHDAITVAGNLLYVIESEGRYAEAVPQRLALLDRAAKAGTLHERDISAVWNAIGRDYRELGRLDESEAAIRKAIDFATRSQGPRSGWRARALGHLSLTLTLAGRFDEAESARREALSIVKEGEPADSPWLASQHAELGVILLRQHRDAEALSELEPAVAAFEKVTAAKDPLWSAVLVALSEVHIATGARADALAAARSAVELARRAYPPGHSQLGASLYALGRAHLALGDAAAAEPMLREALTVRSPPYPPADPRVLEVKVALVAALREQHRTQDADVIAGELRPLLRASTSPYARDLEGRLRAE